jgi:Cation transporter/ATPase, N-terminus
MDQQRTVKQVTTEPLWHEMPLDEVQTALASRNAAGLSHQEALRRLSKQARTG